MHLSTPPDHARHDPILIAGHAAGDLPDSDFVAADRLVSTCESCSAMRRDLVAIAAATRALPAPGTAARDFRLDPAQAERLRRGSWLRAILRPFAAPKSSIRPLAGAFTSLGLAGLLVAAIAPGFAPMAAPAAGERDMAFGAQASAAPGDAAGSPEGEVAGAPAATPLVITGAGAGASPGPDGKAADETTGAGPTGEPVARAESTSQPQEETPIGRLDAEVAAPANPLVAGALALLGIGLGLFGLRFAARRIR